MRALLAAALLLGAPAAAQEDEEAPPIQRYLAELQLGDRLQDVKHIYPPVGEWPSWIDPRGRVTRYKLDRSMAKAFPSWTQILHLGFKRNRLVEILVVYDARRAREKPVEELAQDFALIYGEPRRDNDRFWWSDGRTVLRVFPAELPVLQDGSRAVEWRSAIQIFDENLQRLVD